MRSSKLYILDTNVLLHDPNCLTEFKEQDIVIPITVLEELDRIKDRKQNVAQEARIAIRKIDHILSGANSPSEINSGVPISLETADPDLKLGKLSIFPDHELAMHKGFLQDRSNNDNLIINTALHLQTINPDRQVTLVTKDINMRLKALGVGLKRVEDYRTDQLISDLDLLTEGYREIEGNFWDSISDVKSQQHGSRTFHRISREALPNTFVNEYVYDQEDFSARVVEVNETELTLLDINQSFLKDRQCWGIKPLDLPQAFAMDAINDPNIDLCILNGAAGSGKTLIALASCLEMVIEQGRYNKIIVTRSTPPVAEDIGFLPGTEEEKMTPWLAAIQDNLEAMHENDEQPQSSIKYTIEKANIQFKSLNFIRGRSIQDALVLIDETQNLTPSQLKTILTRCGKGTKMICLGNLAQIDSNYLTPLTSGLTYIVERFKDYPGATTIHLRSVVRSRLAEYAEEHL
ncbi:MAG: PhoH family protein [Motiliproteus sp.]|nr:PhoH family protein [Motiliproteus sp.]MCW9051626.1 PhoH family protein [Motiliproteus sp.]